ncbi:helix-turn-helix transcriptional regulator [Streptomyces sp. NPDC037389]|uniref:helix-turn-helix domain-containing protein n=1 Tax=Streptomyces sp. NPDC037389 TaxID=3155369 RepID=UPI0033FF5DE5
MAQEPENGAEYFGTEVRAWRTKKGMSQRELGKAAQYGQQYVAKVEAGERLASPQFARACDAVFGTPETFTRLRRRIVQGAFSDWFEPFKKLERRATVILAYASTFIVGLLQTEDYAHAIFRKAHPCDSPQVTAEKVERRIVRRQVLQADNPPLLWVILDESCLRRPTGGPRVMAEQLAYLLEQCRPTSTLTLQVLPFASGTPAWHSAFTIMEFGTDEPAVLNQEDMGTGQIVDDVEMLTQANLFFDRLRADALSPDASQALIRKVMEEWTHEQGT